MRKLVVCTESHKLILPTDTLSWLGIWAVLLRIYNQSPFYRLIYIFKARGGLPYGVVLVLAF